MSFNMDLVIFNDVADSFLKLRTYPFFDIAHYILMSIEVKDDTPQSGSVQFSRRHPFACWFSTMLMCFGGAILSNFVCGHPLFTCFDDTRALITATIVWYLINFFPFNIIYKICKFLPVRLVICTLKELLRAKKILIGVHHGVHEFPTSATMCVLLGLLKGAGYCEMKLIQRLVRGVWLPASTEFIRPTFTTKMSLIAALAYYLHHIGLIPLTGNQLFLGVALSFVYLRVMMILLGLKDPLAPLENIICTVVFGGIVDALRNAFERSRSVPTTGPISSGSNITGGVSSPSSVSYGVSATNIAPSATSLTSGSMASSANTNGQTVMRDSSRQMSSDKKRD